MGGFGSGCDSCYFATHPSNGGWVGKYLAEQPLLPSPWYTLFLFLGLHFSLFTFWDHFSIFTDLRVKRAGLGARISALARSLVGNLCNKYDVVREYTMWEGLMVVVILVILPHIPLMGDGWKIPG